MDDCRMLPLVMMMTVYSWMHLVLTDRVAVSNMAILHFNDDDNIPSFEFNCDYAANLLNQCKNPRAHSSFAKPVKEQPRGDEWVYA